MILQIIVRRCNFDGVESGGADDDSAAYFERGRGEEKV